MENKPIQILQGGVASGKTAVMHSWAEEMRKQGHDVQIVSIEDIPAEPDADKLQMTAYMNRLRNEGWLV